MFIRLDADKNNTKSLEENAFGADGSKVWVTRERRNLVFIIWHEQHFTLLVGYTNEKR